MGKGGEGEACSIIIAIILAIFLLVPSFMWFIWGGIITDRASSWKDTGTCRAEEFWWMQFSAYMATLGFLLIHWLIKTVDYSSHHRTQPLPLSPMELFIAVLRVGWILGYTIYAIVLWDTLHNQESLDDGVSTMDCIQIMTADSTGEEFLTLWKVTACFYFTACVLYLALVTVYCVSGVEAGNQAITGNQASFKQQRLRQL